MELNDRVKKKILFVHYGGPWNEDPYAFEKPIEILMKFLEINGHGVQRVTVAPSDKELSKVDAVVFASIRFKEEADKIRKSTGKNVFIVENSVGEGGGESGVIFIKRDIDLCGVARKIEAQA
ncbi:MAG: hypothetical protein ACD_8C00006G0002 [uncultured bacterium]|nr:MAG: hypothetical protein ACD_8C00006G0002 [uncultured bacterium]